MGDPLFAERELLPEESLGQEGTVRARLLPPQTQDTRALVTGLPHDIQTLSQGWPVGEKHHLKPTDRASGCPGWG